jgi:hypothetical protein
MQLFTVLAWPEDTATGLQLPRRYPTLSSTPSPCNSHRHLHVSLSEATRKLPSAGPHQLILWLLSSFQGCLSSALKTEPYQIKTSELFSHELFLNLWANEGCIVYFFEIINPRRPRHFFQLSFLNCSVFQGLARPAHQSRPSAARCLWTDSSALGDGSLQPVRSICACLYWFVSCMHVMYVAVAGMSSMTELHLAARDGNVQLVDEILEGRNGHTKVSINVQNAVGQTPMHLAAKWGRLNVIEFLIEAGADLEIKDRKGRTPLHEAKDSRVQAHELRQSSKLRTQMDVSKMSMLNQTFQLKQARKQGDLTEVELDDALDRLEASSVWNFQQLEQEIDDNEVREVEKQHELERIEEYMRMRPEEIKQEIFKQKHKMMQKREKEEERERLEQKRLKEIQEHEERRQAEKRREERREVKELLRERTCGKCGQVPHRPPGVPRLSTQRNACVHARLCV